MKDILIILGCFYFYYLGRYCGLLLRQWKADRETKKVKSLWMKEFEEFLKRDLKR